MPRRVPKILVGFIGIGRWSWAYMRKLCSLKRWDRIILYSDDKGISTFREDVDVTWVFYNHRKAVKERARIILSGFPPKSDGLLCVSLRSGSGGDHMAMLMALRLSKRPYRAAFITSKGVELL